MDNIKEAIQRYERGKAIMRKYSMQDLLLAAKQILKDHIKEDGYDVESLNTYSIDVVNGVITNFTIKTEDKPYENYMLVLSCTVVVIYRQQGHNSFEFECEGYLWDFIK